MQAHFIFSQSTMPPQKKIKRACKQTHQDTDTMDSYKTTEEEQRTANSTYKKLAIQWLNQVLCFVSSVVVADSFRLRNRQLLVAAKRYGQVKQT